MAQYEYELIEQKKKQEKKIAGIIILVIPILMFILGILLGIGQLNANPQSIAQHVKTEDLCQFCFPALNIPTKDTTQSGSQETTYEPVLVNFKSNYNIANCVDTISPTDITIKVVADKPVFINTLTLYVPLNYTINKVQDNINKIPLEFETKATTGANTINILIKNTVQNLDITINGKFATMGQFNILPIIVMKNDNKNTLPTISVNVKKDCTQPQTTPISSTPTPTVTPMPSTNSTPTATATPEATQEITITPSEVPNTGIVDSAILFTIGVVIGLGILKLRKVDLHYEKINSFFSTVYKTAYGLLIRSFGTKTYTEQKILEKVVSTKSNKNSSSSP